MLRYFANLNTGKTVLWCYLIWYLNTIAHHFDPTPAIWLNAMGISAIIGVALLLSVGAHSADHWQTFRLFMMPFGVSSFSQLIKGQGFVLIFPPDTEELLTAVLACTTFIAGLAALRRVSRA